MRIQQTNTTFLTQSPNQPNIYITTLQLLQYLNSVNKIHVSIIL